MIPVEVTPAPWHYTTFLDWLDHWQSLVAGLVALLAALVAVLGSEFFARGKEGRDIEALRDSLASEIRLYFDLLIKTRDILKSSNEVYSSRGQLQRDFRDLARLPPPIVYPVAADKLGHVRRPSGADVVEFYATIEQLNFSVRTMTNHPSEKVLLSNHLLLIEVIEKACQKSLPLLSELPFDERDTDFRTNIAKWAADHAKDIAEWQADHPKHKAKRDADHAPDG